METLNLEKFSPTKTEIIKLAEKYKDLFIKNIDDIRGYAEVDVARKELKKVRVEIQKTGKLLRSDALAFQKAIIAKENELITIIEPIEIKLQEEQNRIELEKEKIRRQKFLPERKIKLKEINIIVEDDFLLLMNDIRFDEFFNQKKQEFLEEKERKIKEAQEK